ncbi:MAG: phage baseplate assembly protein W [Saprospiraceae bacterium]|jgi:phage baseplate assembly protein W
MNEIKSFLGKGWSFPVEFSGKTKKVVMVSDEEDIAQSLFLLLSTMPGERVTNPHYGCRLHNMTFENIDSSVEYQMRDAIRTSVLFFEPRISLDEIKIDTGRELDGIVYITLFYTIRKVNIRSNIVYPFYLLEGSLVDDQYNYN